MNILIYLKNVMIIIVIAHVIVIVKKQIKNVCVLLINILNFVKKIVLLSNAIDQIISKKLNLHDENTCIRKIDMLITMFINLYHNSNIDCNKNVKNKTHNLYQHLYY